MRGGDEEIGMRGRNRFDSGILVRCVGVAMQKHDRKRFHPLRHKPIDFPAQCIEIDRGQHFAVRSHALRHFRPQITRHQRFGLGDKDVIELELALAANLDRIAEPDQSSTCRSWPLRA